MHGWRAELCFASLPPHVHLYDVWPSASEAARFVSYLSEAYFIYFQSLSLVSTNCLKKCECEIANNPFATKFNLWLLLLLDHSLRFGLFCLLSLMRIYFNVNIYVFIKCRIYRSSGESKFDWEIYCNFFCVSVINSFIWSFYPWQIDICENICDSFCLVKIMYQCL